MGNVIVSQRIATGLMEIEAERVGQVAIQLYVNAMVVMGLLGVVIVAGGGGPIPLVIVAVTMRMVIYLLMIMVMQVFMRNRLTERVILVRQSSSLHHSEHQGVIKNKQKCHDEFYMHVVDFQTCNVPGL